MSHVRNAGWKHTVCKCLLVFALPTACAVGTEPEENPNDGTGGTTAEGGTSTEGGSSAGTGVIPKAGTSSSGGTGSGAFGGTSTGGKAGSGSGGSGAKAGSGGGGAGGGGAAAGTSAGGASGGGAGGATAGAGGGGALCACATKKAWVDNTVINWKTGDCFSVAAATYVYTGTKAQTYANGQCNPMMQEPWCADSGNDFKFMLCP